MHIRIQALVPILLGLAYLLCAAAALRFTGMSHGVAFVWPANALLAARLSVVSPRRWPPALIACGIAGAIAGWVWGPSLAAIPASVLANLAESACAAALLRRISTEIDDDGSGEWLLRFVAALMVAAPLLGAAIMAVGVYLVGGQPPGRVFIDTYLSHALGMIVFLPAMQLFTGQFYTGPRRPAAARARTAQPWWVSAGFIGLMAAVSIASFAQTAWPLLFMAPLVLAASAVWVEPAALAAMYVLLTVVGGAFTAMHLGPLSLVAPSPGGHIQFLQFYLAATLLATMPIADAVERRQRLLGRLRESEARYRLLADNSTDIIMRTDMLGRIGFVSPSILQLGAHAAHTLIGQSAMPLIAPEHRERVAAAHAEAILARGRTVAVEFLGLHASDGPCWFESHMRAVLSSDGEAQCVVSVIRDTSERKQLEAVLARDARTDQLTGLPNRRRLLAALAECVGGDEAGCIALIDLDHFKAVNDAHGHAAGDAVLRNVATAARHGLRGSDMLARIGGEEFALLMPGASLAMAEAICARLATRVSDTATEFAGLHLRITASIGLAALAGDAPGAMAAADRALYQAKAGGRDRLTVAA